MADSAPGSLEPCRNIRQPNQERLRHATTLRLLRTLGELRLPLIPCQIVPPMQPMLNAPPLSFRITQGHGSRVRSEWAMVVYER